MSSTERISGPNNRPSLAIGSRPEQDPVDSAWSEAVILLEAKNHLATELGLLRSIATRATSGGKVEQVTSTMVSILNDLIPGIEGCLILLFDPIEHQLKPHLAVNLSQDFIVALERNEQKTHIMATIIRQIKPTTQLYVPGNKQFRFLWSSAEREGVRTLWLFPWHDRDGGLLGMFLFTSGQHFSPNRQVIASATLLIDWLSMAMRETRSRGLDRDQSYAPATGQNASLPAELVRHTEPDGLSVLSHELLSPLTLIKGYAATLLQLSDVITGAQREHYCRGIESATDRLIRLLENLRDVSQLETSNPRLLVERTSLSDLLREAASEVQSQTKKHVIRLRLPRALPALDIDRQKISQVTINLLGNAVKYSPQGGDIEVTARQVQSEEKLREIFGEAPALKAPCVIVSVSDAGIGIPEGDLARIFDKFYRVDNRLTRVTPGVGLGLYICRMIVTAHGGHIWARSTRESGSTFFFSLPV